MGIDELNIEDLSDAKERLRQLRAKRRFTPEEEEKICREAAAVFEHYERDMEKKIEEEEKVRRRADYLYA